MDLLHLPQTCEHPAGRDLLQAGSMHCSSMSNIYNCFVGGKQMGSVCINQCTNPHNPLFCQNCEDPRELCAKVRALSRASRAPM